MAMKTLEMTGAQLSIARNGESLPVIGPAPALRQALPPIGAAPALRQALAGAAPRAVERLLVFAPAMILPTVGTAADLLLLGLVYLVMLGADATLGRGSTATRRTTLLALAAILPPLVPALVLAPGIALPLGLLMTVGMLERHASMPLLLLLGGLGGAVVTDLSLAAVGIERGALWLALGFAAGLAFAAARELAHLPLAEAAAPSLAEPDHRAPFLEVVLVTALVLLLGLYGALLAGEPLLVLAASQGGQLTVPLLAAAVWRIADRALGHSRAAGPDRLAIGLVALWALAATLLLG